MRRSRFLPAVLALAWLPCRAGLIEVTTPQDQFGEDEERCSLREAVQAARTDTAFGGCPAGTATDVISVGSNLLGYKLTREGAGEDANATGDLDVSGSGTIAIVGLGAGRSVISGNGIDRIFHVDMAAGGTFILSNLTLSRGDAGADVGGAVYARRGRVRIVQSHLTRNAAQRGGAIYVYSGAEEVSVSRSSITRNRASQLGGGLSSVGTFSLESTTVAENVAPEAGGIHSQGTSARLKNVTVAFNSANQRGGAVLGDGEASVDNSIFAHNAVMAAGARASADLHCTRVRSLGYNLYQRKGCPFSPAPPSDEQADPLLGTLVDAGGGVPVNLLLPGSPAVDSGAPGDYDGEGAHCTSTDQRGLGRSNGCDRGAYEQRYTFTVNSTADAPDANVGNGTCQSTLGGCTLRAALQEAAASNALAVIRVPPGVYDVNIPGRDEDEGATGDLDIQGLERAPRVLVGHGPDQSIVHARSGDRVFGTPSGSLTQVPIGLFGLRISGGTARETQESWSDRGGGLLLFPRGHTTIDDVWFDGNAADGDGGGLYLISDGGNVRITRSAFTRNTAGGGGGGAFLAQGDPLVVRDSLFADNHAGDFGGGLATSNSRDVEIAYSTFTANRTDRSAGGGLAVDRNAVLSAILSSGNRDTGTDNSSPDCAVVGAGAAVSSGYNVIADAPSCPLSGDLTGNLVGVAAPMSRVALLGRPMPWSAPQPGNPAVDHAPLCRHASGLVEAADQLGGGRPGEDDDACTSGAIEGASDLVFADGADSDYPGE